MDLGCGGRGRGVGWLDAAPGSALCTVDWMRADTGGGGRQCCFRARRRWVAAPATSGGVSGLVRPPVLALMPRTKPEGIPFCGVADGEKLGVCGAPPPATTAPPT